MHYPLDHIVIYAADPAISGRFYALVLGELGFEKRREHVFARDGLFIDIRAATIAGEPYQRGRRGVDHIGFRADSAEQVRALERRLSEAGVESGRLIQFDRGDLGLFVADPDGVRIEVTAYASPDAEPVD